MFLYIYLIPQIDIHTNDTMNNVDMQDAVDNVGMIERNDHLEFQVDYEQYGQYINYVDMQEVDNYVTMIDAIEEDVIMKEIIKDVVMIEMDDMIDSEEITDDVEMKDVEKIIDMIDLDSDKSDVVMKEIPICDLPQYQLNWQPLNHRRQSRSLTQPQNQSQQLQSEGINNQNGQNLKTEKKLIEKKKPANIICSGRDNINSYSKVPQSVTIKKKEHNKIRQLHENKMPVLMLVVAAIMLFIIITACIAFWTCAHTTSVNISTIIEIVAGDNIIITVLRCLISECIQVLQHMFQIYANFAFVGNDVFLYFIYVFFKILDILKFLYNIHYIIIYFFLT
ncbi:hypothetical protein RFI_06037 [Reticulomyxa filosa]|uniref:Transmembrane protein n=1 Tax=Reticulomyxa filosa TaxID=46433 RepID=X6NYX1_RETFI|nr:hypothetical protein RFI_06037 [Reticulomyxa filosa]|eukprot:ETO31083.1 hypothetical protein RFI_06037 [Reticulomyxa filosa]